MSKGQLLATIDAAGLQDAYLSAKSAVSAAQATAQVAQSNLARSTTLLQAGAIAQRDLETAQTQASSAAAALADARARLAAAQKSFDNTRVVAPFSGIVSQKSVGTGDVVQPGGAMYTVDRSVVDASAGFGAVGSARSREGGHRRHVHRDRLSWTSVSRHGHARESGGGSDDAAGADTRLDPQLGAHARIRISTQTAGCRARRATASSFRRARSTCACNGRR